MKLSRPKLALTVTAVLLLLLTVYGSKRWGSDSDGGRPWLKVAVAGIDARVELAASPDDRREGLMFRDSLAPDEGMLLVFPRARQLEMWMLNTLIPLDVGFFDARGRLLNWRSMEPDGGRRIYASVAPARYALEMNRGWFSRHDIRPGARLQLPYPVEAR